MIPTIDKFQEAMDKAGGNVTAVARAFGVRRSAVYEWLKSPEYKQVLDDARGSFLDEALTSARILVRGIPDIQNGKQIGWITPPDSGMVRYILGTLGRSEGFGERIDVTTKGESINKVRTPADAKAFIEMLEANY
ncbi:MAG: hypothetical protein ACI3YI_02850 [Bacteroidaceae bacterium]